MVQVQSTWFPLIDRNPQKFTDIYPTRRNRLPESHATHIITLRRCQSHLEVLRRFSANGRILKHFKPRTHQFHTEAAAIVITGSCE